VIIHAESGDSNEERIPLSYLFYIVANY